MMMYVKIIGNNFGNYPYRIGLNTLKHTKEIFDPIEECGPGGLYCTSAQYIFEYLALGDKVCLVTLPENANSIVFEKKIKSDRIMIKGILPLCELDTIKYLVSIGADIHVDNEILLWWCCSRGYIDIVRYLISMRVDVHASHGYALKEAAEYGYSDIVQCLVDAGANIHADNDWALRWASMNGHFNVVKILVASGADVHAKHDYAIRWAIRNGHEQVAEYLADAGSTDMITETISNHIY